MLTNTQTSVLRHTVYRPIQEQLATGKPKFLDAGPIACNKTSQHWIVELIGRHGPGDPSDLEAQLDSTANVHASCSDFTHLVIEIFPEVKWLEQALFELFQVRQHVSIGLNNKALCSCHLKHLNAAEVAVQAKQNWAQRNSGLPCIPLAQSILSSLFQERLTN